MKDETPPEPPPVAFAIGDEIEWDAPWKEVYIRVELPFWLMVAPTDLDVEVSGHKFPVSVSDHFYEYFWNLADDSRTSVIYRGSRKTLTELAVITDVIRRKDPHAQFVERKCKTIIRVTTRCNAMVANMVWGSPRGSFPNVARLYLEDLCRGHLEVINKVVQAYRLATYDRFAFELSSWDVPHWYVDFKDGSEASVTLIPYKEWDVKPRVGKLDLTKELPLANQGIYSLLSPDRMKSSLEIEPTGGELELLDAYSLFERGDYSGAVRRVVTALEVVVESNLYKALSNASGKEEAERFLESTKCDFDKRVGKLCGLTDRPFKNWVWLHKVRTLRHAIVHSGYRFSASEKGRAEMALDTSRWMFNWFENNEEKRDMREQRVMFRSLGRNLHAGIFSPRITADGITLSSFREKEPSSSPSQHN